MKHVVGILISTTIALNAAAFNATDSYINVPIAKQFKLNEISLVYQMHTMVQQPSRMKMPAMKWISKQFTPFTIATKLHLTWLTKNRFVGHYQYAISDRFSPYQIAAGLRNITESPYNSWNDSKYNDDINMSPYIVNTFMEIKQHFQLVTVFEHLTIKQKHSKGLGVLLKI